MGLLKKYSGDHLKYADDNAKTLPLSRVFVTVLTLELFFHAKFQFETQVNEVELLGLLSGLLQMTLLT
jgi:hypothetical protein